MVGCTCVDCTSKLVSFHAAIIFNNVNPKHKCVAATTVCQCCCCKVPVDPCEYKYKSQSKFFMKVQKYLKLTSVTCQCIHNTFSNATSGFLAFIWFPFS